MVGRGRNINVLKWHISRVRPSLLSLLFLCLIIVGCGSIRTQKAFYEPITIELQTGNFDSVVALVEAARAKKKYTEKDRFLYYIEVGLASHYASRYEYSNKRLTEAEDAADELFTKSISKAAASVLLNDNALEYAGEDYEILYTNLIKCLNYLALEQFDEAFVEVKRANLKLEQLEQKYRKAANSFNEESAKDSSRVQINYQADAVRFNNDAFARYLSMHMYAADNNYDDAELDYDLLRRAFIEQPLIYPFDIPDVRYHSDDKAILSIVALQGLSPVKEALQLRLRSDKDLNLVQIFIDSPNQENIQYSQLILPVSEDYYFKFAIPKLVERPSDVASIRVIINDQKIGNLQILEDVARVAQDVFAAKKSIIYLRTLARSIGKAIVAHKTKEKADDGSVGGWLKKLAIDAVVEATEAADLRCSRLLPGKIFVGDFEIAPGTYDVVVEFLDSTGNPVYSERYDKYTVTKNSFNLLEAVSLR